MDKDKRLAIELVITLCEDDDDFRESTKDYNDWFDHMVDQLADMDESE